MSRMFGTDGVRGVAGAELTIELATKLGQAGAYVLTKEQEHQPTLIVGCDTRISGGMLANALMAGICSVGANAIYVGVMPTPAIAYLTRKHKVDAGVVISASHNPMEFNGIKFFNGEGYKLSDALEDEIEALIRNNMKDVVLPIGSGVGKIEYRFDLIKLTLEHDRSLVVAVALVASHKFGQMVIILGSVIILDGDICRCGTKYCTCFSCNNAYTGVNSCLGLHTCTNNRSLCCKKRNGLTLHVGSHQRTVRIIVLQERDQGCSNGEYHSWRYIHVIEHVLLVLLCLLAVTTGNVLMNEVSLFIQWLIRLCYMVIIFLIRCHIYNLIGYTRVGRICFVNLSVRSLYEAVLIDPCIGCKGVDKTDVRSLRSLDRAHSSIVGIMYVSNLESGSVS